MKTTPSDVDFKRIKEIFNTIIDLEPEKREAALRTLHDDPAVGPEIVWWVRSIMTESGTDSGQTAQAVDAVSSVLAAGSDMGAELHAGDVVGAWRLIEEIGRGGMGSVFLVERSDGHFEQRAALKLLAGYATERAMTHLARERQILAALTHPNIARLLDGGATPRGRPYLVLEHVNGQAIDQYCGDKKLSEAATLNLFIEVCKAVAFAHRQLVVHCDLKPSNILVTTDGRPILLDFGVSRLMAESAQDAPEMVAPTASEVSPASSPAPASATLTSAAYTPRYASPEQIAGQRVGLATDVFSLGLMLAELLGVKLITGQPINAPVLRALDADLAAIVTRAVAPAPADRYAGVDALADDLHRYLKHQTVAARITTPQYIAAKFTRRNWPWLAAAGAFFATVSLFAWRTVIERDNARAAEATARTAERAATEVKDYMVSVFQGADPEISGQRDLPVSALLDAGRERLATRLKDQPQTRAEMTGILGSVYQNIGKREQALTMFDDAIALERSNNRAVQLADVLYKKAYTIYDMEEFEKAMPLAEELLRLREQTAPESVEMVEALRLMAMIKTYLGQRALVPSLLDRARAMAVRLRGEDSVEVAKVYLDFGRYYFYIDSHYIEAEDIARKALVIFEKKRGRNHFLYADALEALGLALIKTKKPDEAIQVIREMSERRTALYGEVSNQNGFGLYSYAQVLNNAGRRLEAIPLLERCIVIQTKLDGREAVATAAPMIVLAEIFATIGNDIAALLLANEVDAIYTKLVATADPAWLRIQVRRARLLIQSGNLAEAKRIADYALAQAVAGKEGSLRSSGVSLKFEVAKLLRLQSKLSEAENLLDSISKEAVFLKGGFFAAMQVERAHISAAQGKTEKALTQFEAAETLAVQASALNHPDAWLIKLNRAELLAKSGQREIASELATQIMLNAKPSIDPKGSIAKRLAKLMT